ncbi:MAG TPA: GNAT family protein [Actinophytocola sp.]|uniref:GNAT family N-acetyltransferase n=1 Tax=Actinophytocola sp. TaxID=1872138 RepID=UPI002DDC99F6|nr:GNAT family protein [Actinophytocola sp.]HEV2781320.1 GNAT family protein [Actinophytocola sp.]
MTTARIRFRPVTEDDLDALDAMFADPESIGVHNWQGFTDPRRWRRLFEENGLLGGDRWVLMVDTEAGENAGFVSWRPAHGGSIDTGWEIGISLWPRLRGQGYGTEAHRQLVRYLFTNTPANRIQAMTDAENHAEQRALEKAGFTREGVLRGYTFRAGAWRDEVLYSVLRSEWSSSRWP